MLRSVQVYPPAVDESDVKKYLKEHFLARKCNRLHSGNTGVCECCCSENEEARRTGPETKTFPTNAFGQLKWRKGITNYKPDKGWYVRIDHETDVRKILGLFDKWGMTKPDVILSVLSTDKKFEPTRSNQNTRTMICNSLVKAAASINAWIITGGLNRGVDQLIGKGVKQRLVNRLNIPNAVLGISNWGCLEETDRLLNHSNGRPSKTAHGEIVESFSLNQYHTHSLLVDDGTRKKPECQISFRHTLESALTTKTATDDKWSGIPLVYILIGGGLEEFAYVETALERGSPVIVAARTEGASVIIYYAMTAPRQGATLKHLPDIYNKSFKRLRRFLSANHIPDSEVEYAINCIKDLKLHLFCEIVAMLERISNGEGNSNNLIGAIANLTIEKPDDPLTEIKELLSTRVQSVNGKHSTADADVNTISGMRALIKKLLIVSGINSEIAIQAVNYIKSDILNKMISKFKQVPKSLEAIRKHNRDEGLLLKFHINDNTQRTITSFIVEGLKKVKGTQPNYVYALAADWNDELSFTNLLKFDWKPEVHEQVFRELIQHEDKNRYVQLMLEYMDDSSWLMKPDGPLEQDLKKNELWKEWMTSYNDRNVVTGYKAERLRGKMLFVWCIQKQMPKTAMLFWNKGQDCLAMILVAYKELRKQQMDRTNVEGRQQKTNQLQYFEKLAINFLTYCYANNSKNTHELLVGKVEDLGNVTSLGLAVDAKLDAFLCAEPTERLLNKIWTNDIVFCHHDRYFLIRYLPILLSMVCPLLAPALLTFGEQSDDSKDELQNNPTPQTPKCERSYCSKLILLKDTPLVIFSYWFLSYIAYLILFSIVMLTDFRAKISPTEIALTIWTSILFIEEIRQSVVGGCEYFKNKWNHLDIVAISLYITGFILRMIYHSDPAICPHCLYHARIVMAFSLMFFFFRTLQFLSVYESVGPKIFMMSQLIVADLIPFLVILTVFVSAYGVVSNVILYPNQPLTGKLLQDVFYDAWWSVIQQFNREDALGLNCNKNNDSATITAEYCSSTSDDSIDYEQCKKNQCPANNWIVSVLLAFYALVTCIMLLNVLIAMFNETFKNVDNRQKDISAMLRYQLICEYSSNLKVPPPCRLIFAHMQVPPPFCVICYPYYIFLKCRRMHTARKIGSRLDEALDKTLTHEVKNWQDARADDYFKENQAKEEWPEHRTDSDTSDNIEEAVLERLVLNHI